MMFRRKMDAAWGVLVGGLCALAVGCGDGTTEPDNAPDNAPLTMTEAVALFEGMRAILQDSAPRIIHASEDSTVAACPLGGQVRLTGVSVDGSVADTLRLVSDFTAAPTGCQISSGGLQFTVDGAPGIRERTEVVIVGFLEHFSIEGSATGRLDWQLDDRSGSCDVDLVLSGEPDLSGTEPTVAGVLSGTLCGHEAEIEVEDVPGPAG
ncbi:hypothetical protein [Candidatus Palauibacter sp.]|uniref:hypothetical protein n=1 Tax=Candidatus Palauibacter sp. TaxID=3101350 RepID=UPI003B5AB3EF